MLIMRDQRGDTIIEVLFAITIFSLIAVGGLSLMHQGTALAQRALEISHVRQQIDAQADALRYINKAYVADYGQNGAATALWNHITSNQINVGTLDDFAKLAENNVCHLPIPSKQPFALDVNRIDTDLITNPPNIDVDPIIRPTDDTATYARVRYDDSGVARAEGIWIQAVRSDDQTIDGKLRPGFYDFHIRACWYSVGQARPMVAGTIVRLYEPRG